jgi:hypothetical protein
MASCSVVTVAMATGAEAEEIGVDVAKALGFRCVNGQLITRAAQQERVTPEAIDEVEHSAPLIRRILDKIGTLSTPAMVTESSAVLSVATWNLGESPRVGSDQAAKYRTVILEVISAVAREGNAVIIAHGAGIFLAGMPGVLRTFVTGSPAVRGRRLAAAKQLDERRALRRIEHTDRERRAFLERFFDLHRELPTNYDLVINTDVLPSQAAVAAIVAAARAMT